MKKKENSSHTKLVAILGKESVIKQKQKLIRYYPLHSKNILAEFQAIFM